MSLIHSINQHVTDSHTNAAVSEAVMSHSVKAQPSEIQMYPFHSKRDE